MEEKLGCRSVAHWGQMAWFNEVAIDPHNPSLRYVATPHGVFVAGKESSTAIVETQTVLPEHFSLGQNAPNPFNSSTIIPYEIATAAAAELAIYNVAGQRVRTFVLGYQSPGEYRIVWDGRDDGWPQAWQRRVPLRVEKRRGGGVAQGDIG